MKVLEPPLSSPTRTPTQKIFLKSGEVSPHRWPPCVCCSLLVSTLWLQRNVPEIQVMNLKRTPWVVLQMVPKATEVTPKSLVSPTGVNLPGLLTCQSLTSQSRGGHSTASSLMTARWNCVPKSGTAWDQPQSSHVGSNEMLSYSEWAVRTQPSARTPTHPHHEGSLVLPASVHRTYTAWTVTVKTSNPIRIFPDWLQNEKVLIGPAKEASRSKGQIARLHFPSLTFKQELMCPSSGEFTRALNLDLKGTPFVEVTGNLAFLLSSGALWWWIMYGASMIQTPVHWEPNQSW